MANLLPQHIKKDLRKEYRRRLLIVVFISCSFVIFLGIVSLLPTYAVLQAKEKELVERTKTLEVEDQEEIADFTEHLEEDMSFLQQDTFTRNIPYGLFAALLEIKTDEIVFDRIAYSQKDNSLEISGTAKTRSSLKLFIDRVENERRFLPIENFPWSSLSDKTNIPFRFSIKLHDDEN